MKKLCVTLLFCLCCATALADFDPEPVAYEMLTKVYGYTQEEADAFCLEYLSDHELAYYSPEHPDWIYTTTYSKYSAETSTTPFHVRYINTPNEGEVRGFIRSAWENQWFVRWSADTREAVAKAVRAAGITPNRSLSVALLTDDVPTAQLIQAFFTSCYGVEANWPEALVGWRDEVLAQHSVALSPISEMPASGIVRYVIPCGLIYSETAVCEFKGDFPEELKTVFQNEPHLSGWDCVTGTIFKVVQYPSSSHNVDMGIGLAAFEKNGQRQLVALNRVDDEWKLFPIGFKALEQDPDAALSITASDQNSTGMTIRYDDNDGMHAFDVSIRTPANDLYGSACLCYMEAYESVSANGQDKVYIDLHANRFDEWSFVEQHNGVTNRCDAVVHYPACMGLVDVMDMPRDTAQAMAAVSPIPEGYAMTGEVHLRKDHSSRSANLGTLQAGTLIQVQDTIPGEPFPWVKTTLGQLRGYVCEQYTSVSSEPASSVNQAYPLAVAETKQDVKLKSGTGWFDRTVQPMPAGTRMRVMMDKGEWIYVVVPRAEYASDWLMDIDGAYGYVKKSDVSIGALGIQLDWK